MNCSPYFSAKGVEAEISIILVFNNKSNKFIFQIKLYRFIFYKLKVVDILGSDFPERSRRKLSVVFCICFVLRTRNKTLAVRDFTHKTKRLFTAVCFLVVFFVVINSK